MFLNKLVIVLTISLLGFANADKAAAEKETTEVAERCKVKVGATSDDVSDVLLMNPPKTKEGKCMHECIMQELKMVDKDGKLQRNSYREYVAKYSSSEEFIDLSMKVYDICAKLNPTINNCEGADQFRMCLKTEGKKMSDSLPEPIKM